MFDLKQRNNRDIDSLLIEKNYTPALAKRYFDKGEYSKTVELCREYLKEHDRLLSIRLIYARSLYAAGQLEQAKEQFYKILTIDPQNLIALKFIGDIKFANNEEYDALGYYNRVFEIDQNFKQMYSALSKKEKETTKTIVLKKSTETKSETIEPKNNLRDIPFLTETMGDLYLAQGHFNLAARVFRELNNKNNNSRLTDKLSMAEEKVKEKTYVKKKN